MDVTAADPDVVGLVDACARAVVALVVGAIQLEALEQTAVRSRIELDDGARRASDAAVVEARAGKTPYSLGAEADAAIEQDPGIIGKTTARPSR